MNVNLDRKARHHCIYIENGLNQSFPLNGTYLRGFVFHAGRVLSVGVTRPLACEVRPRDRIQGRCPPDGTGIPNL